ncbi:Voltage-gated hydrogen channel 1-like 2 [Homarus americanus]|uniref:Voltage-gated hydrogen channel 1 n=1 Tax=Homarus americanus TaxID=6706 RepID=A0A8J5KGG3_HOMAM|nr:Voltage-gated hydrogen channel 1-like 2 [Homarus americanus]
MSQIRVKFSPSNDQVQGLSSNTRNQEPPSSTQDHNPPSNSQEKDRVDAESVESTSSDGSQLRSPIEARGRLRRVLTSTLFQIVVVVLVIVDTVVVVAELILDLGHHHNENSLAPLVLHALSLVLLSLFFIEVLLKIYTFRREFLTQKAEVLDAVVVTVALCLDIVFVHHQAGYGLIIILRLWRVVRIQNAVIMQVRLMREERRHRALGNQRGTTPIS